MVVQNKQKMSECKTSSITVANGWPLNNEVPLADDENLEKTSIVINK